MTGLLKRLAIIIAIGSTLWAASQWWEKGLATRWDEVTSPNGCYRLESLKPFWVLPNIFHPRSDPNEDVPPQKWPSWKYPGFYRLYDNRTGELLGESRIYDLHQASGPINWGISGVVYAGLIPVGPTSADCPNDQPAQPLLQPPQVCVERL